MKFLTKVNRLTLPRKLSPDELKRLRAALARYDADDIISNGMRQDLEKILLSGKGYLHMDDDELRRHLRQSGWGPEDFKTFCSDFAPNLNPVELHEWVQQ